jgi:hypothetical protein
MCRRRLWAAVTGIFWMGLAHAGFRPGVVWVTFFGQLVPG